MKENEAVEACKNAAAALEKLSMVMQDAFKVKTGVEPNEPELPKRWKDLKYIKGYYVSETSGVSFWDKEEDEELEDADKNVFATKEQAEAAIALAQLSQLREVYRKGWKPDWNDILKTKYCIEPVSDGLSIGKNMTVLSFLSFQSEEIRDEFLENFRDLIERAKPLMS